MIDFMPDTQRKNFLRNAVLKCGLGKTVQWIRIATTAAVNLGCRCYKPG